MVEYRRARAQEAADILDFINYVFSQAHKPHDFKKFNPPMYGSDYPFWKEHYVAVEEGRIKATLSITRKEIERGGEKFVYGHVGQVSVHPYARGEGHMKRLMYMAIDDMINDGFDYAELGGQRQRYGYFGFTQGVPHYSMNVTSTNTRHALHGRECSLTARQRPHEGGWVPTYDVLDENGQVVGRVAGHLLELDDPYLAPEACEAYFRASGEKHMTVSAGMNEIERIRVLNSICENISLTNRSMYRIFHFEKYIRAALTLRAQAERLPDGEMDLQIDRKPLHIKVKNGEVTVEPGKEGQGVYLTAMQAQEMLFSPASPALYPDAPAGWFPVTI